MNVRTDRLVMMYAGGFQDASDIEILIIHQECDIMKLSLKETVSKGGPFTLEAACIYF
jgi:hypothetical protein